METKQLQFMRLETIFFLLTILFSCKTAPSNNDEIVKGYRIDYDTVEIDYENSPSDDRSGWVDLTETDSILQAKQLKIDSLFEVNTSFMGNTLLIQPKNYHQSEIPLSYASVRWSGILHTDSGTYFTPIKMKIKLVHDDIGGDDPDEKSGKMVWIDSVYNCDFLIYGLDSLQGKINIVDSVRIQLSPNDTLQLGNETYLYATGKRNELHPNVISDYRLYVADASKKNQLFYSRGFDDTFIEILWMGDLNNDGIYDLIIDTSNHYNRSSPTLFLSLPPDDYHIMELVSTMESVGC